MVSNRADSRQGTALGRRRLLALLGAGAAATLAGCDALQNQSFESNEVTLSSSSMESLGLGELSRDSQSLELSALDGNVSVTITSHTAFYSRAAAFGGQ